ncbi:hypothetical protein [Mycobacterium vicinigordonae]|uniref:Uncharacterized protein n=1 Tax=Mycobacterium vicinigordonae TaxID=1719132 RepID=A0A7D6HTS5_9MYCO|nr:hypothetical protein [Mycobacterium vicinigordonae]QLL07252.1 hypothetical protein H0P51_26935 [Mycobacterium vicinigordonae]
MLHVSSLFVARTAAFDEYGAINATSIPMAWFQVDQMPLWVKVPVVLVVHAPAGGDYDPDLHVVCKDPAGEPLGSLRAAWHWPDDGKLPSKFRCFTQELTFQVETEGEYTVGAYYDADGKFELSTPVPMSIVQAETSPAVDGDAGEAAI